MGCDLHVFMDSAHFGRALARAVGSRWAAVGVHAFPDGETLVRVAPSARHAVLVRSLHDPNAKLVATLLAADALRRAGARRVTLVAPYLPYMRQDAVFTAGEPISQRVIGGVLRDAFDAVLTVEAHLHRTHRLADVLGRRSRSLTATPAIAAWLRRRGGTWLIVGPDEESAAWVRTIGRAAGARTVVGRKIRRGDRVVDVHLPECPPTTRAMIVDDIASSGATLAATARALRRQGVRHIEAIVSHAIFASGAEARLRAAGIRRIASCDTIPHPTNTIAVAPLVAAALPRCS